MDTIKAAEETLKLMISPQTAYPHNDIDVDENCINASGKIHIEWMLKGIILGYIQHEKAHRWLSWAQGIIYVAEELPLDTFKQINKNS